MTLKLALVGLLVGSTALALASSAASARSMAGSQASRGGVVVHGGHLPGVLVGKPKFRTPPKGWWNGHGGPANSGIWFGNGRPGTGNWNGQGNGHGNGHGAGHHDGDHHHGGGHDHGRDRDRGFDDDVFLGDYWGYDEDGDGYVETIPMADQFGFFATGGQVIQHQGARPTYNYDRGYPYEWFNGAPGGAAALSSETYGPRPGGMSCDVEAGVRVCRGW
jgi:hypothetical protein